MVWTIPLSEVAGVLAVSFTHGLPAMFAPAGDTPVQRPGTVVPSAPTEPSPSSDPTASEPTPPELPSESAPDPNDPTAGPAPEPARPLEPPAAPQATDDEDAPFVAKSRGDARERVLRPTDRRRFFHMTAGGASANSAYQYYGGSTMDFQIEAMIGSHAKRFPNFGGAFLVQFRKGFATEFSFAGRLLWDKPLSKSFAIYSSTDFTFGLNVPIGRAGYLYAGLPSALFGIGWGVKAILFERLLLSFRPIGPNLVGPAYGNQLYIRFRWDVSGGIGLVW